MIMKWKQGQGSEKNNQEVKTRSRQKKQGSGSGNKDYEVKKRIRKGIGSFNSRKYCQLNRKNQKLLCKYM